MKKLLLAATATFTMFASQAAMATNVSIFGLTFDVSPGVASLYYDDICEEALAYYADLIAQLATLTPGTPQYNVLLTQIQALGEAIRDAECE